MFGRKWYVVGLFVIISGLFIIRVAIGGDQNGLFLPVVVKPNGLTNGLAVLFVSRQIPPNGSIYWDVPNDLPGVGAHSRFRVAAPGQLVVREADGTLRILVDGNNPTAVSLHLIDVNAPDVSYDGTKIVFAGLPEGNYNPNPVNNPSAWRIYTINVNGTDLQQITFSDQNLDLSQFGAAAGGLEAYDDTDPVWLPDGRIAFSSTRWPSYGHYSGVRATNLYVVNADGSNLHRITAERNGADRPVIDPLTGKIVYARWWRNHRFPINELDTIHDPNGGYIRFNGLSASRNDQLGGPDYLWRNAWQIATINPDGTELAIWGGAFRDEEANHAYGGSFTPDGRFIANYYPMYNMTEAAGFGGLRIFQRGPHPYEPLVGITYLTLDYVNQSPPSYGIFNGEYVTDAAMLPDGRFIVSHAPDVDQDYGLYMMSAGGNDMTLLYDNSGTTEIRAKLIQERPLPPILADRVTQVPSLLPPDEDGPYDTDGTFVFDALNVYFNAPVDWDIVSAIPVGSAGTIRFFIDHQRTSPGSFPNLDWPILLDELPVEPDGSVQDPNAPANVPLFEQIRTAQPGYEVPFTYGPRGEDGAAHVAGMNYGRPNTTARCVGCHAGHTMIPVPANDADAQWTNLAPGAQVTVSSSRDSDYNDSVTDRRVMKGEIWRYWNSDPNQLPDGQWVQLTFPVPVTVRTVRLYNPRQGDEANCTLQVHSVTIRLYSDAAASNEVYTTTLNQDLLVSGTEIAIPDILARVVKVEINNISGTFYGMQLASLAEIEVIARGE